MCGTNLLAHPLGGKGWHSVWSSAKIHCRQAQRTPNLGSKIAEVNGTVSGLQQQLRGEGRLAQLVRASALQAEGHPFEPDTAHHSDQHHVLVRTPGHL